MRKHVVWPPVLGILVTLSIGCGSGEGAPDDTSAEHNAGTVGASASPPSRSTLFTFKAKDTTCIELAPGDYHPQWAYGSSEDLEWKSLESLVLVKNTRHLITYDSSNSAVSISQSQDSSLNGNAKLCVQNDGRDQLDMGFCNGSKAPTFVPGAERNNYGPYAARTPEYCEEVAINAGTRTVNWAFVEPDADLTKFSNDWKEAKSLEMNANVRYRMFISDDGLVVQKINDFCLSGKTGFCVKNEGLKSLVVGW